jgi:hypothetical protein
MTDLQKQSTAVPRPPFRVTFPPASGAVIPQKPCPCCGRCPVCGHTPVQFRWYQGGAVADSPFIVDERVTITNEKVDSEPVHPNRLG